MQLFIASQIAEGANAFLKTEYTYLLPFVAVVGAFICAVLETSDDPKLSGFEPSAMNGTGYEAWSTRAARSAGGW